jgi:hypothetical protein
VRLARNPKIEPGQTPYGSGQSIGLPAQHNPDCVRTDRLAEMLALDLIAVVVGKKGQLCFGFDALGDDLHVQLLAE